MIITIYELIIFNRLELLRLGGESQIRFPGRHVLDSDSFWKDFVNAFLGNGRQDHALFTLLKSTENP